MKKTKLTAYLTIATVLCAIASASAESTDSAYNQLQALGLNSTPASAPPSPDNVSVGAVTIYAFPPTYKQDYSSPKNYINGMFLMELKRTFKIGAVTFTSDFNEQQSVPVTYKSGVGHVEAHIQCRLPDNEGFYDVWTGMSGRRDMMEELATFTTENQGMGSGFKPFADGHLVNGEENIWRLFNYVSSYGATPRYWEQAIDEQACGRIKDMIEFYSSFHYPQTTTYAQLKAKKPEEILYFDTNMDAYDSYMTRKNNGWDKTPVGGSCASYGMGLLKAAGKYSIDNPADNYLRYNLQVSEKLIGGTIDENGQPRKVALTDITIGSLGDNWTYPGVANRPFNGYDPEHIWAFIGAVEDCHMNRDSCTQEARTFYEQNKDKISFTKKDTSHLKRYVKSAERRALLNKPFRMTGIQIQ